jgi:hypothetical protein
MLGNIFGLLFTSKKQWRSIADKGNPTIFSALLYTVIMSLLPAVAWFYGTTHIGWSVTDDDVTRLTEDSAAVLITLFYFTMVASVCAIGYMIHWMSSTYGSESSIAKGIAVAGFSATPMFIAGAIGFIPLFWLALVISVVAVCFAVYLLYLGIPIVMGIPEERGFLFASAVIAFCLVLLTMIMGGSVILWDMGAAPVFTD